MPGCAPGVHRPATADPSAVKSAFLFDKRSRCDPISVLQMSRFPVMLFPLCFLQLPLPRFPLALFSFFLFQALYLSFRPAWTTACNTPFTVLSKHHPSLWWATEACSPAAPPASRPASAITPQHIRLALPRRLLPFLLPLGTSNPPLPAHLSIEMQKTAS